MGRRPYSEEERERGRALVDALVLERTGRGLTQEELARESSVAIDTIRNLEKCAVYNPGFFTVSDMAAALDLSLDRLLILQRDQLTKRSRAAQRRRRRGRRRPEGKT